MCVASLKKLFGRVWENSQQEAFVLQMHCLPVCCEMSEIRRKYAFFRKRGTIQKEESRETEFTF